jgi:hypothetical protein
LNKFAPIAFILLLSCGIALWFLASDSLNVHIKNQLQTIAAKLSQQKVTVENVTIRSYQGSGTITNIIINKPSPTGIELTKIPTLSIDSIDLAINRESLQEDIIIIDTLTIHGLIASYTDTDNGTSLEKLAASVQKNLPHVTSTHHVDIDNTQKQKIERPNLQIVNVIIKPSVLQYISNDNAQITTKSLPQIELNNINTELGSTGENAGIKIFEQLLVELAARSKVKVSSN